MNDYRADLRQYLSNHNITPTEFAEWAQISVYAVSTYYPSAAKKVAQHLNLRHPLSTPRVPDDWDIRLKVFACHQGIPLSQLTTKMGFKHTPSVLHFKPPLCASAITRWRKICSDGWYAKIMQELQPLAPRSSTTPALSGSQPRLRCDVPPHRPSQRWLVDGDNLYDPQRGWGKIVMRERARLNAEWLVVRFGQEERYYCQLHPITDARIKSELRKTPFRSMIDRNE